MATSCWNWEDGVVKSDDGVHVNWPASLQSGGWWNESAPVKRNEKYEEQKRTVYDFFTQAQAYKKANESSIDLRFEAMKTCFTGTKRVYFHANELQQILDIIDLVGLFDLKNAVIIGGYDAYLAADKLKEKNIAIMLPRLHSLPMNDDDAVDLVYQLPFLLQQKGVRFCLQNEGDMEAMNARNLPFLAGTAWAYGLSEEEAIRSISLSTCEILGIADAYGSIEEGKKASIYVSFGNALDMRTNQASVIIVNGIFIPTSNFQTELYLKYKQKLGIK
jgi:imidazolonepropionase-like amidohydrolase